jgi:hypothetical protein
MRTSEAIAEAREMVARNFICEPVVVRALLAEIDEANRRIESQTQLWHSANRRALDERERTDGLIEALQFITDRAGTLHDTEQGTIYCDANWCREQARAAIATAKEGRT